MSKTGYFDCDINLHKVERDLDPVTQTLVYSVVVVVFSYCSGDMNFCTLSCQWFIVTSEIFAHSDQVSTWCWSAQCTEHHLICPIYLEKGCFSMDLVVNGFHGMIEGAVIIAAYSQFSILHLMMAILNQKSYRVTSLVEGPSKSFLSMICLWNVCWTRKGD